MQTTAGHIYVVMTGADEPKKEKNEAGVALGRLGGLARAAIPGEMSRVVQIRWQSEKADPNEMSRRGRRGGAARKAALSPERRSEIARRAVAAREAKRQAKKQAELENKEVTECS